MVNFDEEPWINCVEKFDKFFNCQTPEFQEKILEAVQVIDKIIDDYKLSLLNLI